MSRNAFVGIALAALLLSPALTAGQGSGATAEDLAAAGYTGVQAIASAGGRFDGPTLYFRVFHAIDVTDNSKDCADCRNLVAAYVGASESVPSWALRVGMTTRKMGGRYQVRAYDRLTKNIIIVTGPSEKLAKKLAEILDGRY